MKIARAPAMPMGRTIVRLLLTAISCAGPVAVVRAQTAGAGATAVVRRQRELQERTRTMCRELVDGVLGRQVRTLAENGLGDLPLHGDIDAFRAGMEALVEKDMRQVVDLLEQTERAPEAERAELLRQVQQVVRRISVELAAEQRQVLRRLKVAGIVAQARRLLREQEGVLDATAALPGQPDGQRETAALATLERQKTITALYPGLLETLEEVGHWEGAVGAAAKTGMRTLEEAGVAAALDTAEDRLATLDVPASADAQDRVIAGITALLDALESAQAGGSSASGGAAGTAAAARALADQARQVREDTAKSALDDEAVESLADRQSQVRDQLERMAESAASEQTRSLAEQAGAAAEQARQELFEGNRAQALARQDDVQQALEQLAAQQAEAGGESGERSEPQQSTKGASESRDRDAGQSEGARTEAEQGSLVNGAGRAREQRRGGGGESTSDEPRPPDPRHAAIGPESRPSDPVVRNPAAERRGDASVEPRRPIEEESWFARLPPEARAAIRARSQRRAPRGYEEKLERYFRAGD